MFLDLNGIELQGSSEALYELTMGVAEGKVSKEQAAAVLRGVSGQG